MAFLDFIRNRQQQPAEQSQQKPETAKEMYSREASNDRNAQRPVERMPEAERAQAKDLGARLDKATQHLQPNAPGRTSEPEGATGPEAMRQNMTGQDKAAPALSPTSAQSGQPAHEQEASAPSQDTADKSQQQTRQTMARTRPSWER